MRDKLRQLPSVDTILRHPQLEALFETNHVDRVKEATQNVIDHTRQTLLNGEDISVLEQDIVERIHQQLDDFNQSTLQTVINATGTVLHTNFGRALLSQEAVEAVLKVAQNYNNLEYNLDEGTRGSRYTHLEALIQTLTGAEAALVVNNNAAAVTLILTTLTQGREVLISRGELVEIGGSFRVPDVITSGGAILKEVGSTNKTNIRDYEQAINEETGAVIRVHTSNYKIVGFTSTPSHREIIDLAHEYDIPAINDLGSGLLIDLQSIGLSYEPTVKEMIEEGYDLVSFRGDKLLGGPQAGIIVGRKKYIDRLKKAPLLRALRTDKLTLAALDATLRTYLNPEEAFNRIPTLRMLGEDRASLRECAEYFVNHLNGIPSISASIIEGYSQVGGGSYPAEQVDTSLVSVTSTLFNESEFERTLRLSPTHIIPRIHQGQIQFDVRTLSTEDIDTIIKVISEIHNNSNK